MDRNTHRPLQQQLYDLSNDPHEKVDLAEKEPEIMAELNGRLLTFAAEYNTATRSNGTLMQDVDDTLSERLTALGYLDE